MPNNPISDQADQELLQEILSILKDGNDDERQEAMDEKIVKLKNRQAARDEFITLMDYGVKETPSWENYESDGIIRGWAATALMTLALSHKPEGEKIQSAIKKNLETEKAPYARYWMVLALYKISKQNEIESNIGEIAKNYLKTKLPVDGQSLNHLESEDKWCLDNTLSGPLALAIKVSWGDREAVQELEKMLKSQDFYKMWAACHALKDISCRKLLEPLAQLAGDQKAWPDLRYKSVKAMGLIECEAAVRALGGILMSPRASIVKEAAIEGLENLGQSRNVRGMLDQMKKPGEASNSVADALTIALIDENAQIRHRAAEALPKSMIDLKAFKKIGDESYQKALVQARKPAIEKVVSKIVCEQVDVVKDLPLLVDALRVIEPPDAQTAAEVLNNPDYFYSEDISVRQRAKQALQLLGGAKALQTLMGQKSEVLNAYTELLSKADEPIQDLFKETMLQAQRSFSISQAMSIAIFVLGIVALGVGMYVAFTAGQEGIQRIFGAGTSIIAVIAVILDLLVRDPYKRVQETTSILLRTKVIFLGYLRQIHQIDAIFKHEFIEGGKEFGIEGTEKTIKQIKEVMKETTVLIAGNLGDPVTKKLAVVEVLKPYQDRLEKAVKAYEKNTNPPATEGEKPE